MRVDEYVTFDALGLAQLVRDRKVTADELLDVALEQVAAGKSHALDEFAQHQAGEEFLDGGRS